MVEIKPEYVSAIYCSTSEGKIRHPKKVGTILSFSTMKLLLKLLFVSVFLFSFSCTKPVKFPSSSSLPAAEITASKKQDSNKNYIIEVKATNLASPEQLSPKRNNYSVWILTANGEVKNIGQLLNKNEESASLKATTPFNAKEIFITAGDKGNVSYPSGVEISRVIIE